MIVGGRRQHHHHGNRMAGPTAISDPTVAILEECLRERSNGTMIASLRDIWLMARRHAAEIAYDEAARLIVATGRYRIDHAARGEPGMVHPLTPSQA